MFAPFGGHFGEFVPNVPHYTLNLRKNGRGPSTDRTPAGAAVRTKITTRGVTYGCAFHLITESQD